MGDFGIKKGRILTDNVRSSSPWVPQTATKRRTRADPEYGNRIRIVDRVIQFMGTQDVQSHGQGEQHREFMRRLLADLHALERMLEAGQIESGVDRIGVEQELDLIDDHCQPAPIAPELLERITDPRVTSELARFNLEFNLEPLDLGPGCLRTLHGQLLELLSVIRAEARKLDSDIILTGILPTLGLSHLGRENIFPSPRYHAINDAITASRGGHYELRIKGADELTVRHDSVMLEALNTSFQIHYQVSPDQFPLHYNIAQLLAAPVLAGAVNSPVLFGKRLWRETRIAIFQQAVDTRGDTPHGRETQARVRFGDSWVQSVLEIFRDDVARFRILISDESDEDPNAVLDAGGIPKLAALGTHNSTVYRWNRVCYGINEGKPTLRIENRVLPSGPSPIDEVANAAFWFGLMKQGPEAFGDVTKRMDFHDVAANFTAAAREGLGCVFHWLDDQQLPADTLIREQLLPIARQGLASAGLKEDEINKYLDVIDQRVATHRTGAKWLLNSAAAMRDQGTRAERLVCLAASTVKQQSADTPVHEWEKARLSERTDWRDGFQRVEQYMTTDLYTVRQDELLDLAASIMDWEHIRHIPVEDADHHLVGLVSYRSLLRVLAGREQGDRTKPIAVADVMQKDPITIGPQTTTLEAISIMRDNKVACLPVLEEGRLVGIISERDFAFIAVDLLEKALKDELPSDT